MQVHIPLAASARLIASYAGGKLLEQTRAIAIIGLYLALFQALVLGGVLRDPGGLLLGIAIAILGLAMFMEGLRLGVMPLAEAIGLLLPQRRHGALLAGLFAFVLGAVATAAEPAVAVLRVAGSSVTPWQAPLLFLLINRHVALLYVAIATGVGLAIAGSVVRLYLNLPLKLVLLPVVTMLVVATLLAGADRRLAEVLGLAWDSGAVTTGPVTVPIIVALSVGVSRILGKEETGASFGAVTLASLLPVGGVLLLALALLPRTPQPMEEADFWAQENRQQALALFATEPELIAYGARHATDPAVRAALAAARDQGGSAADAGSDVPAGGLESGKPQVAGSTATATVVRYGLTAVRAVVPLAAVLLLVLAWLRERPRRMDEIVLGLVMTLVGLAVLNAGIDRGLTRLGQQVGSSLPVGSAAESAIQRQVSGFDPEVVLTAITPEGERRRFFYLRDGTRTITVPFEPSRYDAEQGTYTFDTPRAIVYRWEGGIGALLIVFLFALVMGFGATIAEPALNTLGQTVERLSVGTLPGAVLVRTVGVGVGFGLVMGVARIVLAVPLPWILAPIYLLLLLLNLWASDDFINIGWDSAGVTTGPVTVPLVLAMGVGLSSLTGSSAGFGILATASAAPIMAVLVLGLRTEGARRQAMAASNGHPATR